MISFPAVVGPDGGQLVTQSLVSPAVYLDTWAIRLFAEDDPPLGERFRAALLQAGGTLMLSLLNFSEFTFEDPRHFEAAGRYVDRFQPHIFFSHFDPFRVRKAEFAIMTRQTTESPAGERTLLRLYAQSRQQRGYGTVRGLFGAAYLQRDEVKDLVQGNAQVVLDELAKLRKEFEADPEFDRQALARIKESAAPRSTTALLRTIIYLLYKNRGRNLKLNDGIDFAHCIVPAAYCDYLFLDRSWNTIMEETRRFMARHTLPVRVAKQVARKAGGVERFIEEIEALPTGSAPT